MKHATLNDKFFDAMLEAAIEQDFQQEIDDIDWSRQIEHIFSHEHVQKIRELFHVYRKPQGFLKAASKIAVVIFILLSVSFAGLMSVEAVRQEVFQIAIQWYEKYVDVFFKEDNKKEVSMPGQVRFLVPSYIPEGYDQNDTVRLRSALLITYVNTDGLELYYEQSLQLDKDSLSLDGEGFTLKQVEINKWNGIFLIPEDESKPTSLIWSDGIFTYQVSGYLNEDEILKIAKNILPEN